MKVHLCQYVNDKRETVMLVRRYYQFAEDGARVQVDASDDGPLDWLAWSIAWETVTEEQARERGWRE
jgi:hypothetical protein